MKLKRLIQVACIGLFALYSAPTFAQSYPNRPIRLVVGYPPGGGADLIGRVLADSLGQKLKTSVIVINTPGAGSTIASAYVAKAAPDGYTLYLATSSLTINPSIYKSVHYDPIKDFVPIEKVGTSPFYIIVQAKGKLGTIRELLDAAKKHPGQLTYASGGLGSVGNLSAELFKSQAGVNILHVPFRGEAPAIVALMGGTVDMAFVDLASVVGSIRDGRLKALATTSPQRTQWFPGVPTIAESGLPGYNVELWYGVFAPAGTADNIVNALHGSLSEILKSPSAALKSRYQTIGDEIPEPQSRKEFSKFVRAEVPLWRNIITKAGIEE